MSVETAEAQKAQNQVAFLENFFDEVRRKVPVGKQLQSRLTLQISNKNPRLEVVWAARVWIVGYTEVILKRDDPEISP